jgi:hypothetical protein
MASASSVAGVTLVMSEKRRTFLVRWTGRGRLAGAARIHDEHAAQNSFLAYLCGSFPENLAQGWGKG